MIDLNLMRDGESIVLSDVKEMEHKQEKMRREQDRKERELKENIAIQNEALRSLGDMLAKMNEVRKISLRNADPEIRDLADTIIKDISGLQSKMSERLTK